jgi:hypothetical protein
MMKSPNSKTSPGQIDPSAAVRTATIEYIRYVKRMRLKELSGRVEVIENWEELEQAELDDLLSDVKRYSP